MSLKTTEIKTVFPHADLIREEKIDVGDLPTSITRKMVGFNLLNGKLKKQPDNQKIKDSAVASSVEIADAIQNWSERNLEEKKESMENAKDEATQAAATEKKKAEDEAAATEKKKAEDEAAQAAAINTELEPKNKSGFYGRLFGR